METMRRARWGVLLVCVVAILVVMLVPAASAKPAPPTPVLAPASGVWTWTYVDYGIEWGAMLDGFAYNFNDAERGTWKGTFNGKSVEPWCVYGDPEGNVWALISIGFRGKVAGHYGTADIALTVEIPSGVPEGTPMTGHWSVVTGTGGLKGLFGMGTWTEDVVAEAETGTGVANYSGAWWLPPCRSR
jgi:hypothetical protein